MQINLKQAEIVTALKQYIVNQGISINGKNVQISFTAGRKESGISADIAIEDIVIPGVDAMEDDGPTQVPVLTVVPPSPPIVTQLPEETNEEITEPVKEEVPVKAVSLFS